MNTCAHPPHTDRVQGFALVVSLTLMAFVVLLLISLSSFLTVESRNAHMLSERSLAEQNALLAIGVALGELQKHTGPDQRITARSDIYDEDPSTRDADGILHPEWTGVWDSQNGDLLTWLVSGNAGRTPTDSGFVDLSYSGENVHIETSSDVHVPRLVINDEGAYAYWLSDEGTKAKVNMTKSSASAPLVSAAHYAVGQMTDLDWVDRLSRDALNKVSSVDQLMVSAGDALEQGTLETRRPDLTTYSMGLLTNTREGGLKQDLTLALFNGVDMPTGQIFGPLNGSGSDADKGGPLWSQLQSWVDSSGRNGGELTVRPQTDDQTGQYPVVTQVQLYLVPRYDTSDGAVHIELLPAITLWNPYDRPLEATDYRLDLGRSMNNNADNRRWTWPYYRGLFALWQIRLNDTWQLMVPSNNNELSFSLVDVRLEPGETLCFSPPGNAPLDVRDSNLNLAAGENELTPGFRPYSSYSFNTGYTLTPETLAGETEPQFRISVHGEMSRAFRLVRLSDGATLNESFYAMGNRDTGAPSAVIQPKAGPVMNLDGSIGLQFVRNFVEGNSNESLKWLAHYNPRAAGQGLNPMLIHDTPYNDAILSRIHNPSLEAYVTIDGDDHQIGFPVSGASGGTGYSINPLEVDSCVLFESAPDRSELFSIGQLMHAPLYLPGLLGSSDEYKMQYRLQWGRFDSLLPAYAIGSSAADPLIPLDELFVDWGTDYPSTGSVYNYCETKGQHYDYSYLLNDALWDAYFFSGLPEPSSRSSANSRLVAIDPDATEAMDSREVAGEFMIDGAFNVNSTSEDAWRGLLGAFYGEQIESDQEQGAPYLRVHDTPGEAFHSNNDDVYSTSAYKGYRTLTSDQIANLAHQIVQQIKWRGPFQSLAEFVNRAPGESAPNPLPQNAFRLQGALAAALEAADEMSASEAQTELGISAGGYQINTALSDASVATVPRTEPGFTAESQEGWRTEMLPGWLSQADLLARLGAVLTNRSDTFTIRVYGEHSNATTGAKTTAYGEAIVQRIPEFIDPNDDAAQPLSELTQIINTQFGRRYVLIGFRWLDKG